MEYLTTVELSERWNITSRRIGVLCAEGRIEGAIKKGKTWLIPSDAIKPADGRYKKNQKNIFDFQCLFPQICFVFNDFPEMWLTESLSSCIILYKKWVLLLSTTI